ncbi:MAG: ArgE/DapE family deacylase [Anaerolineales bacterium]|nr:ArgE/DapE family deacylase [Anaerolineales bacterium]
MIPPVNELRVTSLLAELVKIESINPRLVPGGSGEKQIAEFIRDYLAKAGIETHIWEVDRGRSNVVGLLRGTGTGKTLLINAHLDTVSVEGMDDPFSGQIENGKLYGRGAADDKGGIAAAIEALITLKEMGVSLEGDFIVAGVADEEYSSLGTEELLRKYSADGCIIAEPSRLSQGLNLGIGVGSGGYVWAEIETLGKAAHGSMYWDGIDAIEHMGYVLVELSRLKKKLAAQPPYTNPLATHQSRYHPSLHAALIKGGVDLATYPESCVLSLERRLVYGETFEQVREEINGILARISSSLPGFQAKTRVLFERNPWEAEQGPLLDILFDQTRCELGESPAIYSVNGWDDGALMSKAGIPTVVFGPSGDCWHASGEYVDLKSLVRCARILTQVALRFCGS